VALIALHLHPHPHPHLCPIHRPLETDLLGMHFLGTVAIVALSFSLEDLKFPIFKVWI
jgi:hypothetical protein